MQLELISTRRCPFVQRSLITLNYKNIEHQMTFVDLDNPPAWFSEISPFGKVPLLRVDKDTVIFESAVINEFLDEITPGQLHPTDPYTPHFGTDTVMPAIKIITAEEQQKSQ